MKRLSTFSVIVLLFVSLSLTAKVEAFSFSPNPVTFFVRITDSIVQTVSDLVYYLVRQREYLFDDYQDPNVYPEWTTPESIIEEVIDESNPVSVPKVVSGAPISVEAVPAPEVKDTAVATSSFAFVFPPIILPKVIDAAKITSVNTEPNYQSSDILIFTNEERKSLGLSPLSNNKVLDQIASLRMADLFDNRYFSHESPDSKSAPDLAKIEGYDYILIGENLALGNFDGGKGLVEAWMGSPGHRANILNSKYKELGVAEAVGDFEGRKVTIAVQIFGQPRNACPGPSSESKSSIAVSSQSIKEAEAQAKIMYDYLSGIKGDPNLDLSYYNQKVQEYNYFARQINEASVALKKAVKLYNGQVLQYNNCVGS